MKFATAALSVEAVLIACVILYVPYTEIDWRAYMEQVSGFLNGELDYRQLKGGTGPLVYPGGFVWIYSMLYYFTKLGEDIQMAQWIFAGVYLTTLFLVLRFYTRAGMAWSIMLPLFLSKRLRSLYVLRLFNDCWAMLFLFTALTLIAGGPARNGRRARSWVLGSFFFSFAVSIKMNVLLFAPGMLYVMLRTLPLVKVLGCLCICAAWQLVMGLPFLVYDYEAYLTKGFELGRVFTQRWSVNYQFLDNEIFVDPHFGMGLLAATVAAWVLLWRTRWSKRTYLTSAEVEVLRPVLRDVPHCIHLETSDDDAEDGNDDAEDIYDAALDAAEAVEERTAYVATVLTFFESNLIGVAFARSLHYQFYTWFFLTVPFVLYYTSYSRMVRLVTFALIRQAFEVYPPTENTSLLLQTGFGFALVGVLFFGRDDPAAAKKRVEAQAVPPRAGGVSRPPRRASAAAAAAPIASASPSPTTEEKADGEQTKKASPSPPAPKAQSKANKAAKASPKPAAKQTANAKAK